MVLYKQCPFSKYPKYLPNLIEFEFSNGGFVFELYQRVFAPDLLIARKLWR